jgi:hypothetical protein
LAIDDLKQKLIQILSSAEKALSMTEVLRTLEDEDIEAQASDVRGALRELEKDHKIASLEDKNSHGNSISSYRMITKQMLSEAITRNDFEEQEKRKLLRELIDDSTGRYSTMPPNEIQSMFATAARSLLLEDPRHLFIEFAKWLKVQHMQQVSMYKHFKDKGRKAEAERHYRNLTGLERYADSVFTRMLGVPTQLRNGSTLRNGPFFLRLNRSTLEDASVLSDTELAKYVGLSVYGAHVIERFSVSGIKPPIHTGGTDASIQPISISQLLPWQVEPSEINIVTSVGVRYDIYKGVRDFDRHPDPRVLAQYERNQAIGEGLLIPPSGSLGFEPEMEDRVKEAAMDLRQYTKDFEMMFSIEPNVKVHFRDGRVFPMEHRLSDALQTTFHGEMVRASLKAFRNIVNMIGTENGDVLYSGFVKRAGVSILAPFVMWYIGFGSKEKLGTSIDPDMALEDFLKSSYTDNYVVNRLFSSIKDQLGKNEVYLSFRILRRFQSMEEPFVQNFEPTTDRKVWSQRLKKYGDEMIGGGSEESGADLIANLCAHAAIVQFYCSLILNPDYEPKAQIPRLELLLPYLDFERTLSSPADGGSRQEEYIRRILSTMFYPGVLEPYPDQLFYFSSESPEVFIAPKPVCDAHISAKEIAHVYRDDFIELLVKEAKLYWLEKKSEHISPVGGDQNTKKSERP